MIINEETHIYKPEDIWKVCKLAGRYRKKYRKQNINYYNIPASFDIEVSSFYKSERSDSEKVACMYIWTFCISGYIIVGRTWEEFVNMIDEMHDFYNTDCDNHFIIYVHNLSYEFQFIRKLFRWKKVFSLDTRKPIQAVTIEGIEFRCSYLLSGYGLAKLSDQLLKYKVKKKVGDLDYNLIRHSKTPLSKEELQYCVNDVLVVVAYIQELIEKYKSIARIPLTKTGFVRNYTRQECLYDKSNYKNKDKYAKYRKLIKDLVLDTETYSMCKRAFAGGFTHANPLYSVNEIIDNVDSFDECSAYPAVMCSERFPMSKPEYITIKSENEFYDNINYYNCIFEIEIVGLQSAIIFDNYISSSHCYRCKNMVLNNGRVVSADSITTTITEQDFLIIRKTYYWDEIRIHKFIRFKKAYLPKAIILSILKLFGDKTTLKGVEGKESEYMRAKEDLNSVFGMTVTDICRDEITYSDNEWSKEEGEVNELIDKYNKSVRRFLYYPWGIYVTAYARRNLWTAILEFGDDYIYSDTDSVKVLNKSEHSDYFENYNRRIVSKLEQVLEYYKIDKSMIRPKTIKGKEKIMGVWEHEIDDGCKYSYKRFKTLGAKRYMYETENGDLSLTVSGLNKKTAIPYMKEKYGDKVFEHFDDELTIPAGHSGRTTHTYIDDEMEGYVTDYLGNTAYYHEYSSVHIENSEYSLSLASQYITFLQEILVKSARSDKEI